MICPDCKGEKKIVGLFPCWADHVPPEDRKPYSILPCQRCNETGEVPDETPIWREKGELLKDKRISRRITLREASKRTGIDVISLSKMERGCVDPIMEIYDNL